MQATECFAAEPASVQAARRFVRDVLAGEDDETAAPAVLLTSELVTNAVLHGRTGCEVTVVLKGSRLRIAVRDGSSHLPLRSNTPSDASSGRGLQLVEALAAEWGVDRDGADGKLVWFEVTLARPASDVTAKA